VLLQRFSVKPRPRRFYPQNLLPKPGKIRLGEIERGELLGDLTNQARELEKDAKQNLALQALRRPRRRRRPIVHCARGLSCPSR